MNKYKNLIQRTVKTGIVSGAIFLVFVGLYVGVSMLSANATKAKSEAEGKYSSDKAKLDSLTSQDTRSTDAERRFAEIMQVRDSNDFSGKTDVFLQWIAQAKEKFRMGGNPDVKSDPEALTQKQELVNLVGYGVYVRPGMKLDLQAVTDVHVFSLLDEMRRTAPGIIRIDGLTLKRNTDLTDAMIESMKNSGSPSSFLVSATIELTLIGIRPKENEDKPTDAGAAGK